jgi:hypothetical protein
LITEVIAGCAKKAFIGQRCCIAIRVEKEEGEIGESLSLNALPLRYPILSHNTKGRYNDDTHLETDSERICPLLS